MCSHAYRKQVGLNHRLTFGALPGGPHVLHTDVQVGSVEAAVFGFGVVILQILPEKLRRRRRRRSQCELQPCLDWSGGGQTGFWSHLVRLRHVHRPVCVVVHLFVDAADRLETQQGVFILTELLVYHTQIYNTETTCHHYLYYCSQRGKLWHYSDMCTMKSIQNQNTQESHQICQVAKHSESEFLCQFDERRLCSQRQKQQQDEQTSSASGCHLCLGRELKRVRARGVKSFSSTEVNAAKLRVLKEVAPVAKHTTHNTTQHRRHLMFVMHHQHYRQLHTHHPHFQTHTNSFTLTDKTSQWNKQLCLIL